MGLSKLVLALKMKCPDGHPWGSEEEKTVPHAVNSGTKAHKQQRDLLSQTEGSDPLESMEPEPLELPVPLAKELLSPEELSAAVECQREEWHHSWTDPHLTLGRGGRWSDAGWRTPGQLSSRPRRAEGLRLYCSSSIHYPWQQKRERCSECMGGFYMGQ